MTTFHTRIPTPAIPEGTPYTLEDRGDGTSKIVWGGQYSAPETAPVIRVGVADEVEVAHLAAEKKAAERVLCKLSGDF